MGASRSAARAASTGSRSPAAPSSSAWAASCGRASTASPPPSTPSARRCSELDWWVFAEGTGFEAREYLARFLEEGAAAAAAGFGDPKAPVLADFSLASVPEVLAWIGTRVEVVDVPPPAEVPEWVQAVLDQNGGGFRDLAEVSRPLVLQAAYYLGASFVTSYPVLRWDIGREDRPEVRQPVVTGFGSGEDLPVLAVAENALLAGDPGAAVRQWRHAVAAA